MASQGLEGPKSAEQRVVELERELLYRRDDQRMAEWTGLSAEFSKMAAVAAEQRVKRLEKTLRHIADPVAYFRAEAKQTGSMLNGPMAVSLSNSADYLKQLARDALATIEERAGPNSTSQSSDEGGRMSERETYEVGDIQLIGCMCEAAAECACGARVPYNHHDDRVNFRCPACGRHYQLPELEKLRQIPRGRKHE